MDPKVAVVKIEEEITRYWEYFEPPLVSIMCISYNHGPYIKDAIEGFLMQETDFPFEIVIHDDASTDRTADIIREYEERYPNLIKPIYQVENQYSKEGKPATRILNKKMRGEFVAVCEGDDYWTDPLKLQIQIDEMRKYPECDICFHSATMVYQDKSRPDKLFGRPRKGSGIIPLGEVIRGGGGFMPTASIVIAKEVLENFPEWFYTTAPVGDLFWQIYGSKRGGALFIDRNMAVYRAMVPGSWSQRAGRENDYVLKKKNLFKCIEFMATDFRKLHRDSFNFLLANEKHRLAFFLLSNHFFKEYRTIIEESWSYYPEISLMQKLLYAIKRIPRLALLVVKIIFFVEVFANKIRVFSLSLLKSKFFLSRRQMF